SSDVCSSDLPSREINGQAHPKQDRYGDSHRNALPKEFFGKRRPAALDTFQHGLKANLRIGSLPVPKLLYLIKPFHCYCIFLLAYVLSGVFSPAGCPQRCPPPRQSPGKAPRPIPL